MERAPKRAEPSTRSELDLLEIQIETLFQLNREGRLCGLNESSFRAAPRFFLGRTRLGNRWLFRHDVPPEQVRAIEHACRDEPVASQLRPAPLQLGTIRGLLERSAPVEAEWRGPAFRFGDRLEPASGTVLVTEENAALLEPGFADLLADLADLADVQPCAAVVRNGAAVSVCCSARIPRRGAEAGVRTLETHRQRGYAAAAVSSWAAAVQAAGCIPLYSTSWDNDPSLNVARRLGLMMYGEDCHLT